jgi:phosphohistidine swiveling domain-containing protein
MKYIDSSKNYQRLFHFDGMYFLMNDVWMAFYKDFETMITTINDDCYMWVSKNAMNHFLNEGAKFFADQERFDSYYNDHVSFLDSVKETFHSEIQNNENLTLDNVKNFLELCRKHLFYFHGTDFHYTDKAYKLSESNPVMKENLMKNYVLKERSRVEIFNDGWFGDNSQFKKMIRKLSKQFNVSEKDLEQYGVDEIYNLFNGVKLDQKVVDDRKDARVIIPENGNLKIYSGKQVVDDIVELLHITGEKTSVETKKIKGIIANKGKVTGRVKIIISDPKTIDFLSQEMEKMNKGDILVAETTSPEFMPACRKASAILANQGGLLSHAAVVSREFGIPCIVGLRYATKVLKDGDEVEVNADNGTVKILKRAN